jgi:hypothetical protein
LLRDNPQLQEVQKKSRDKLLTMRLFLQVVSVDGAKLTSYDDLRQWSKRERTYFRNHADKMDRGYDTAVVNTCPNLDCGTEFSTELPIGSKDFFFPSETEEL